ncbi:hypothetical protein [Streptomyces sp. NPDC058280]|uniref:hypothetical protein n=1 Tax=Streptomyces sp. NPDC058280 TaxID=3346419 RepID=UPI0036E0B93D
MAWQPGQKITAQRLRDNSPFVVAYTPLTSPTAATTSTSPQTAIVTPAITFRAGRAYRLGYRGGMTSSTVGQTGTVLIARSTAGGAVLLNSQRIPGPTGAAGTVGFYFENIVVNNTGADITTVLVATYQMVFANGGTIAIFGSSTTPAYVEAVDIGLAADYAGATSL